MPNVKTAISMPEALFKKAEEMANRLEISRSQLFALALESFIRQYKNKHLLEKINAAYSDAPDSVESQYRELMKDYHRSALEGEW